MPGAVLLGLGSIVGTGIFVSVGIAAGVAGSAVVYAVVLAALLATANGLSSASLAASHPVSGGTYEYGYRYLNPTLGFVAGWMFLCAKSASAATAALGFAGYALMAIGRSATAERILLGLALVVVLTLVVAGGIRRSNRTNAVIVSLTLLALASFVLLGLGPALRHPVESPNLLGGEHGLAALLHATALMFVAYTGYGRIATMGEEVRDPQRSIPRAMVVTLAATLLLYVSVAFVAVAAAGAARLAEATRVGAAPLAVVARELGSPLVAQLVALGAVTAMMGVVLNLLLGLSRVLLAMSRRRDVPGYFAHIDAAGSPRRAVIAIGVLIAVLTAIGSVKISWSFSAFTVLIYYALTNLAALRLPEQARRYPRWVSVAGLCGSATLAFFIEYKIWLAGLGLLAVGLVWHRVALRLRGEPLK